MMKCIIDLMNSNIDQFLVQDFSII